MPRVSKAAILFGPNASGKSNLLGGFRTLRSLILHSTDYSAAQFARLYTPFRFGCAGRPTEFELDVLLGTLRYRYAVSYDGARIRSERLLVYQTGKSQRWFDRRYDDRLQRDEWAPFSSNFKGPREVWRKATRPQALFLTTAAKLNAPQLAPLIFWAERCLNILSPRDVSDFDRTAERLRDPHFKSRLIRLLRAVDLNVSDVRVSAAQVSDSQVSDRQRAEMQGPGDRSSRLAEEDLAWSGGLQRHGGAQPLIEFHYSRPGWAPVWADSIFESAGVHRLMNLFAPVSDAIDHGGVLLIDEFDTSLHPLIARFLIQLVSRPAESGNGAQLLLTSHNVTLMDLDILRRDQIWLMSIDEHHASILSSLRRDSPRKNERIAKNYLKGRYAALPDIELNADDDR